MKRNPDCREKRTAITITVALRTVRVFGLGGLLGLEGLRLALVIDGGHPELVVLARDQVRHLELGVSLAARSLPDPNPTTWGGGAVSAGELAFKFPITRMFSIDLTVVGWL